MSPPRRPPPSAPPLHNTLEMTVSQPPAVFIRRAQLRKFFATPDAVPRLQPGKRLSRQMSIQSEKFFATGRFMLQDDQRSVVQRCNIIRGEVNDAVQRRAQPSPRLDEKIHAQMHGAPFIRGIPVRSE